MRARNWLTGTIALAFSGCGHRSALDLGDMQHAEQVMLEDGAGGGESCVSCEALDCLSMLVGEWKPLLQGFGVPIPLGSTPEGAPEDWPPATLCQGGLEAVTLAGVPEGATSLVMQGSWSRDDGKGPTLFKIDVDLSDGLDQATATAYCHLPCAAAADRRYDILLRELGTGAPPAEANRYFVEIGDLRDEGVLPCVSIDSCSPVQFQRFGASMRYEPNPVDGSVVVQGHSFDVEQRLDTEARGCLAVQAWHPEPGEGGSGITCLSGYGDGAPPQPATAYTISSVTAGRLVYFMDQEMPSWSLSPLVGRVVDRSTGTPIAGATIQGPLQGTPAVVGYPTQDCLSGIQDTCENGAATDAGGWFVIAEPIVGHFSASASGYATRTFAAGSSEDSWGATEVALETGP